MRIMAGSTQDFTLIARGTLLIIGGKFHFSLDHFGDIPVNRMTEVSDQLLLGTGSFIMAALTHFRAGITPTAGLSASSLARAATRGGTFQHYEAGGRHRKCLSANLPSW